MLLLDECHVWDNYLRITTAEIIFNDLQGLLSFPHIQKLKLKFRQPTWNDLTEGVDTALTKHGWAFFF